MEKQTLKWTQSERIFVIELPWLRSRTSNELTSPENFFMTVFVCFYSLLTQVPFLCSTKSLTHTHSLSPSLAITIVSLTASKLDKFKLIYSFHFVHLEINLLYTFGNFVSHVANSMLLLMLLLFSHVSNDLRTSFARINKIPFRLYANHLLYASQILRITSF